MIRVPWFMVVCWLINVVYCIRILRRERLDFSMAECMSEVAPRMQDLDAWLILFDDDKVAPEVFTGPGREEVAKARFASLRTNCNITLFRAVGWS